MDTSVQFAKGAVEPYKDYYLKFFPNANFNNGDYKTHFKVQVSCINPGMHLHGDKHQSAFFSTRTGVYHCSTCAVTVSFQRFLTDIIGIPIDEALEVITAIKQDETIMPKFDEYEKVFFTGTNELTKFVNEARAKLTPSLPIVADYLAARSLTYETLVKAHVGYVPANEENLQIECLIFPYYLNNKVVAVRGRTIDGRKGGIKGSRFVPFNINNAKESIILCEGESDTLRMQQLLDTHNLDFSAVGVPSATFRQEFLREFSDIKKVIIVPQDDLPSTTFANLAYNIIRNGLTRDVTIQQLKFKQGDRGKDVCDWLLQHSEEEFIASLPNVADKRQVFYSHKELLDYSETPTDWIVENFIARGEKIIIGGEQKSMKTYFCMFMLHDLIQGKPLFGIKELTPPKPVKVMLIEEEGGKDALAQRIRDAISPVDTENIRYGHKLGLKLDNKLHFEELEAEIKTFNPDLLVLDPLQRLHLSDEDSASEMAVVWDNIHNLTAQYPNMSIIIIQHFRKGGGTNNYWDSLRGSNRGAGEVDVGIFVRKEQKKDTQNNTILSIRYDGRNVKAFESVANEYNEFKLQVNTESWSANLIQAPTIDLETVDENGYKPASITEGLIHKVLEKGHLLPEEIADKASLTKKQVMGILQNNPIFTRIKLADKDGHNHFYFILETNKHLYKEEP